MATPYKGFSFNQPGDPKPWGSVEYQAWQDMADNVVGDAISTVSQTGGHQHNKLYGAYGSTTNVLLISSGNAKFTSGGVDAFNVEDDKVYSNLDFGIGNTAPSYRLDVYRSTGQNTINIDSGVNTESQAIYFSDVDGDARGYIQKYSSAEIVVPDQMHMVNGAGLISFYTGTGGLATRRVTIDNAGNTGFGRVNPSTLVELYKEDAHPILTITAAHATDYDPQIRFETDATPTVKASFGVDGENNNVVLDIGSGGVGGSTDFVFNSTGLGIGQAPEAKLDVVKSSDSAVFGSGYPVIRVKNTLATIGNGVSTFNYALLSVSAGNGVVQSSFYSSYDSLNTNTKIGTTTNHDFILLSNTLPRITIKNTGEVGINDSTPSYRLDVKETLNTSDGIHLVSSFADSTSSCGIRVGYQYLGSYGAAVAGCIYADGTYDTSLYLGSKAFQTALKIDDNLGYVGINKTDPAAQLDLTVSAVGVSSTILKNTSSTGLGVLIWGGDTTEAALEVCNYAGSSKFKVNGNGRIYASAGLSKTTVTTDRYPVYFNTTTNELEYYQP